MKKIIIGAIALIVAVIIGSLIWYNVSLSPVSSAKIEENELIRVEIEKGVRKSDTFFVSIRQEKEKMYVRRK